MGGRLVPDDDDDVTDYVFTKYRSTEFNHFPISHFPNLILIFLKTKPTKTISQNKEIFITGLSQGALTGTPCQLSMDSDVKMFPVTKSGIMIYGKLERWRSWRDGEIGSF